MLMGSLEKANLNPRDWGIVIPVLMDSVQNFSHDWEHI
jgi:hypothetical protein